MKILHVCISGPFTDGMSYQENELVSQHVAQGHDVTVIASTEVFSRDKQIIETEAGFSLLECGASLIRLPYSCGLRGWLATKVRAHKGLRKYLEVIQPDRIMFHGLTAWDLLTVAAYVRRNPGVKLFADCHEDFNNSAKTWASRQLLHRFFYKRIFSLCINQIQEVLCITVESLNFAIDFYGSPPLKTRMYPLGCTIESVEIVERRRIDFRSRWGFLDSDIVITQTGKLDHSKQLLPALLAFCSNSSSVIKFVVAGQMTDDVKSLCMPLIQSDSRIVYLGWQSTDELRNVLSGADCFIQPFGQTVTTQMAMGFGCVILVQDLPSHRWLVGSNGRLFKDVGELDEVFKWVVENQARLNKLKQATSQFASTHLDYGKLALEIITK